MATLSKHDTQTNRTATPKHDTQTNRTVVLDFNGGTQVYRNPELGLNIPAQLEPGDFSAARRAELVSKLNREYASESIRFSFDVTQGTSTVHIGRTHAFDAFGHFLGLAEGIGSGDAFVLLDASANDAELVDVIRHEAGHILGTLDHGGTGLARYAWQHTTTIYNGISSGYWQRYLKSKTTATQKYSYVSPPSDLDGVTLQYHSEGTEITTVYDTYDSEFLERPDTNYSNPTYTTELYRTVSGRSLSSLSIYGGSADNCSVSGDVRVSFEYDHDEVGVYGSSSDYVRYSNYQYHFGSASGCLIGGKLTVDGGCVARQCEAGGISVGGSKLEQSYDSTLASGSTDRDDKCTFTYERGLVENCNVTGGNLIVGLGGEARNIIVKSGGVLIGNDISINTWYNKNIDGVGFPAYDEAGRAELRTELENYGAAKVTNLIVEVGTVTVNYGGELYGADINGSLTFSEGAVIGGVITCKGVMLWEDVVPQTNIKIKIDLHDYAVPNYTEEIKDEQGRVVKVIDYFANYTTKIYSYTYFSDGTSKVTTTTGTFNNNDGRFDMTNWKYRFSADIGQLEYASALPYILVDLGGTEKDFDEGWLGFYYPTSNSELELNISGDKRKWEEQWGHINGADSPIGFLGSIAYNAALYGEAADVLWLEFGEDPEVDYTIDLASEMAGASKDLTVTYTATGAETLTDAKIQGATLVVKGSDVESANLKVQATDSGKRDHECDLELLVVPESIPIIGKEGTKKYAAMLKKAQKNHITTEINDILPYNIHTKLFGMSFDLTNMGISLKVDWTQPSMTVKLQGKMEWAIGKGTAGTGKQLKLVIDLSGDNYISITCRGKNSYSWDLVGELKVPDFKIGKFEFSNMALKVNKEQASFSVSAYVKLPWIKYSFGGSIGIVDGYLDSMSIGVDGLNVPLGTSGLFLQKIEGGISGIATELNLSFEGTLGLTAGPKFSVEFVDWLGIDDGEYSLCELTLSGSISTAGNLKGSASITILGGLATGSGSASFDGSAITVTGSFTFLNGCISIEGELHAGKGGISIIGTGTATVPRERIFGPLAGLGMSANVAANVNHSASNSYVMAWQQVELLGNVFTIGFKSTFEGEVTLLGATDLLKEEDRSNLRSLKSVSTKKSISVAAPLLGASEPSASKTITVNYSGISLFQFQLNEIGANVSLTFDGTEYTQAAIEAGLYDNMQVLSELSGDKHITIAVNNAQSGDWTMNAYDDANASFGVYSLEGGVQKPVIATITVGEEARSATITYALGDLSGLTDVQLSIYRTEKDTDYTGQRLAVIEKPVAEGSWEWVMEDELAGGDYSFYLMVESEGQTPVRSDISAAYTFCTLDTEAPDQIQTVSSEWKTTGTIVTWDESWDNQGVAGYKIRYAVGDEDMAEIDVKTNTFTFDKVPNGTYDFQVAAYDEAGNLSDWSEEQSVLVLTTVNAKYKDATLTEAIELAEYDSAVNITAGDFAVTAAANSLISGSVLADAGISGIVENTSFNGTVNLYDGAEGYNLTVNGELTIGGAQPEPEADATQNLQPEDGEGGGEGDGDLGGEGSGDGTESPAETPAQDEAAEVKKGAFADGITVKDGGVLVIEADSEVRNITVEAGGSLALKDDAVYDHVSIAYGAGLSFVGGNSSIYRLTGDIWTAGTLGTYRTISGGGHKIHFEQYKQTDELVVSELYSHDDIAFLPDLDKLSGKVLDIVIDSTVYGQFKIADKATYFEGTITVTDHASGVSAEVGFDQYTLVGKALCKFRKDENNVLYLTTERAEISAPTVTVENANSDQHESATINVTPSDDSGLSKKFSYRYSASADMSDAIVVEGDEGLFTGTTALLLNKDDLVNNGTYYVQACVENIYGVTSPWSEAASFTAVQMVRPDAPATLTVSGATDKQNTGITFTATGVDNSNYTVREYRFRYADNPEMKNAVVITTGQRLINYASIQKSGIEDGKDYYVQAGVKHGNDWSYWSDIVVFNTQGWDYENITIGPEPDGDFNYFTLGGKRAKDVTVIDGGYFYGGTGEVDGLTIEAGGFFRDDGATVTNAVMNGGEYWLSEGSVTDIVVNSGEFTVRNGALNGATIGLNASMDLSSNYMPTITGTILIQGQFTIYYLHPGISTNAEFVFDVGAHEANKDKAFISYVHALRGTRTFTAKLDDTPEIGDYRITSLYQVPENGLYVSLNANDGTGLGTMQLGGDAILHNGLYYSLIDQKGIAYLHVSDNQDPPFIGAVKLSKNGIVYDSNNGYSDFTVSATDECDYALVGDGGQVSSITVGDGGNVDVYGDVFGATVGNGGRLTLKESGLALSQDITIEKGGEVVIDGGKVDLGAAFHLAGGTITVNGTLHGREEDSGEWGATRHWFVFELDKFSAAPSGVMISDYSLLQCNPEFTATVSTKQAKGEYKLAGNADNFTGYVSISYDGDNDWPEYLYVGNDCMINGTKYALAVKNDILTLTVGGGSQPGPGPDNPGEPDGGQNNDPINKDGTLNPGAVIEPNLLAPGGSPNIVMDASGSVSGGEYSNYVGGDDKADYAQIKLDKAVKLSFTIEADSKVKLTFYQLVESRKKPGTYTKKSLKTVSVSGGTKSTASVLVEGGDDKLYYVAVENKNKKNAGAYYNVSLNTEEGKNKSEFFSDGDDKGNNGPLLVKSGKNKVPTANNANFLPLEITESGTQTVQFDTNGIEAADAPAVEGGWNNFVGFGDVDDYVKLSAAQPLKLNFAVTSTDKVKFVVYRLTQNSKGKWTSSAVKSLTVSPKKSEKNGPGFATRTLEVKLARLVGEGDAGYYLSVQSANAKSGGKAWYNVNVDSTVYASDYGANNTLFLDKKNKILNAELERTAVNPGDSKSVVMEKDDAEVDKTIGETTYGSFVGFGDEYDYAEIRFDDVGDCTFNVETWGTEKADAKFTVYKLTFKKGKWTKKSLATVTLKNTADPADGYASASNNKTVKITEATNEDTTRYFVSMQSVDAKKGKEVYYNIAAEMPSVTNDSALSMPETDVLAGASVDAACLDSASDKLFGESSNGLLASL